jgi:hypothetical protein
VENSAEEMMEITNEDINDIRRKIKKSLKEKGKPNFIKPRDSGKGKIIIKKTGI